LAIDLTLIPYHGQPQADPKEIYRSKAKDGTSHFHAYAPSTKPAPSPGVYLPPHSWSSLMRLT
jgi:hypothetical protein